jgi:hypothetical protein
VTAPLQNLTILGYIAAPEYSTILGRFIATVPSLCTVKKHPQQLPWIFVISIKKVSIRKNAAY